MDLNNLGYFLWLAIPAGNISNALFGYNRLCRGPSQLGEHWLSGVTAQQSWEVRLYKLMVINQIEQQAVSWQTPRSMSVPPPLSFPATPCFNSQNYFCFHLSEVLVPVAQGRFWCMQLPKVSDASPKPHAHTTAEAQLRTCWLQIWGMQIFD